LKGDGRGHRSRSRRPRHRYNCAMPQRTIVVFSGGLDSTTLLYHQRAAGDEVRALSVDYGQRHRTPELAAARAITIALGVEHRVLDLRGLVGFFGPNGLTDAGVALPEGEYSPETMALTVVPNRNMVLLAVALAWASSSGADAVALGAHGGDARGRASVRRAAARGPRPVRDVVEGRDRPPGGRVGRAAGADVELLRRRAEPLRPLRHLLRPPRGVRRGRRRGPDGVRGVSRYGYGISTTSPPARVARAGRIASAS